MISLINPKNDGYCLFKHRFKKTQERLKDIPINEKSDEAIVPVYIHSNFFVRKIFADRFNAAYKMTSFKDKIVLDYGCGSGIFLASIEEEINKGIGVDIDVDVANKVITSKKIILTDITNPNELFQYNDVDIITAFDVLEHVNDLDNTIDIFSKILNHHGKIIISGPTENAFYRLARKIATIGIKGGLVGKEEHVRNIFDIKKKMLEAGFIVEKDVNLWNLFHIISFKVSK